MSAGGTIQAEGIPAKVLEFLREHPDSTSRAAFEALGLPRVSVFNAITRLRSIGLVEISFAGSPRGTPSRYSVRGNEPGIFSAAPLRALSPWGWRETGVRISDVRLLRRFTIGGR